MTIDEFRDYITKMRPTFYKYPQPVKTYIHWTAGHRYTTFSDYHFCVDGDGDIILTKPLDEIPEATYRRNTGSIAIAACCCVGAYAYADHTYQLGAEPPTDSQIETMAEMMAAISDVFGIPLDIEHFMTHAEAADNMDGWYASEPYGPAADCERWDFAVTREDDEWMTGGDTLRGKAIWYQNHA